MATGQLPAEHGSFFTGLTTCRVRVGDRFTETADLRMAVERCFWSDGNGRRADLMSSRLEGQNVFR